MKDTQWRWSYDNGHPFIFRQDGPFIHRIAMNKAFSFYEAWSYIFPTMPGNSYDIHSTLECLIGDVEKHIRSLFESVDRYRSEES